MAYRGWAEARLADLHGWTSTWAPPEAYAGVRKIGAQEAWYAHAARVEHARSRACAVLDTSFDMFEAFDQIERCLVYLLLLNAGCPVKVVTAYLRHLE
eukprot:3251588-Alexandrium_andersonii.AAC.1